MTLTGALLTDSGSIPDSQKNASNSIESYEYGWRLVLNILNGAEMNIYIYIYIYIIHIEYIYIYIYNCEFRNLLLPRTPSIVSCQGKAHSLCAF